MNKTDIIESVAQEVALTKADATRAVEAVLNAITEGLKRDKLVSLVNFATLTVKARAARTGRNPKSGETINIPASNAITFKAGKALKDAVN